MQTTIMQPTSPLNTPLEISVLRIRFTAEPPANAAVFARFNDPRAMAAVGEPVTLESLSSASNDPLDRVDIVTVTVAKISSHQIEQWLASNDYRTIKSAAATIHWRPGRAVLHAKAEVPQPLLQTITEFSFYESELRKIESAVKPFESTADADVSLAYEMNSKTSHQWDRLYRTMEQLYRLRLQFARLEPRLDRAPDELPLESRGVFRRLSAKSNVADRLEAVSNRLETCEDLYEGAIDRITDYKAYRRGNFLEIAIVILLALEVALMLLQWHGSR